MASKAAEITGRPYPDPHAAVLALPGAQAKRRDALTADTYDSHLITPLSLNLSRLAKRLVSALAGPAQMDCFLNTDS